MSEKTGRGALYLFHRSVGTVVAFVGVLVFYTGSLSVLQHELDAWVLRDQPARSIDGFSAEGLDQALALALAEAPERDEGAAIFVATAPAEHLQVTFSLPDTDDRRFVMVDPAAGAVRSVQEGTFVERMKALQPRQSLERFLVQMHIRLLLDGNLGLWVTGLAALALLVLLGSGLVVAWPRRRHWVCRPRRSLRQRVGDIHVLIGVWSAPFAFVLSLTGAFFSFAGALLIPVMIMVAFEGDQERVQEVLRGDFEVQAAEGEASFGAIVMAAKARAGEGRSLERLRLENWSTDHRHVVIDYIDHESSVDSRRLAYDGQTGEFLRELPILGSQPSGASTILSWISALHFGNFMGLFGKALWLLAGLFTTLLAVSGYGLWAVRNESRSPRLARLARTLTGAAAGLPLATGAAIAAWAFAQGPNVWSAMTWAFFVSLALAGLAGAGRQWLKRVRSVLLLGALASASVPFIGRFTMGEWASGDALVVDVFFVLFAFLLALASARLPRLFPRTL
ncbi:MAG: PepSY-associated TM helix domain-containing protein [Myxococcota bacterium]